MLSCRLESGEVATLLNLEGDKIRLRLSTALAPGQPIVLHVALGTDGAHEALQARTLNSRRHQDAFVSELRTVSLSRKMRAQLQTGLGM